MQEQIEAVQRMQEYIEKHLRENISFCGCGKGIAVFSMARKAVVFRVYRCYAV